MQKSFFRKCLLALALAFCDGLAIFLGFVLAFYIRSWILADVIPVFPRMIHGIDVYLKAWPLFSLWLVIFAYESLYPSIGMGFWEETKSILKGNGLAFIIVILLTFATKTSILFSRPVVVFAFLVSLAVLPLARHSARDALMRLGLWQKDVLIIGFPSAVRQVLCNLAKHPDWGLHPIGLVIPGGAGGLEGIGLPVYRDMENLDSKAAGAEEVIVAMPHLPQNELVEVVEKAMKIAPVVKMVPDLYGVVSTGVKTHDLDGMLLLEMEDRLALRRNFLIKRSFDALFSLLGLILFSPLLLLLAAFIKIDSQGPVFFYQKRLGRGGQPFTCYKFRTMQSDAQDVLQDILDHDPLARAQWERDFKLKDDPRITGMGSVLRKASLDELPQLWNVLKGEMSIVGPRPIVEDEMGKYGEKVRYLFKVPPGMTGLWQVSGRSDVDYEERILLDEYYAKNWSLWLDIEIIMRTFGVIWKRDGAY